MKDRFKSRVWDKKEKQMHYNDFVLTSTGYVAKIERVNFAEAYNKSPELWNSENDSLFINQKDLETDKNCVVMMCTGQEDKNSQLIYEGDIIYKKGNKDYKNEKLNSVVIYDSMYCCFELADENGCHRMPANSQNLEVLGNIYENLRLQTCYKSTKEFES